MKKRMKLAIAGVLAVSAVFWYTVAGVLVGDWYYPQIQLPEPVVEQIAQYLMETPTAIVPTAMVVPTITPMPTKTLTPASVVTVTVTATKAPTKKPTAVATQTVVKPSPTATAKSGLLNGDELAQDDTYHQMSLLPNQWVQLVVRKNGTVDVQVKNDPDRQVEFIIQSPQQSGQTRGNSLPVGSGGSACDKKLDCNTIVQARGPENGKYLLYAHNTRSSNITVSIKATHGEGGCPSGTHNSGPYWEPINGKMVYWVGWCVND